VLVVARYLLLAIDDNADAAKLVKSIKKWGVVAVDEEGFASSEVAVTVRAVFAKPDKFCDCARGKGTFTRGTKLGWWVCAICKKPSKLWANGDMWYLAIGVNMLPISESAPEWRGPNHAKHPGYIPTDPEHKILGDRK
jgi:hypothetical protein